MKRLFALLMCWLVWLPSVPAAVRPDKPPLSMAFFYGVNPPWDELQLFDVVVVDPEHVPDPATSGLARTQIAAYVALGEVQPTRPYASQIPAVWIRGKNEDWGSQLIDQSQAAWPAFFTEQVIAPLWAKGYRTFFLDTLDSYHRFSKTPADRAVQEAGMVAVLDAVVMRYPSIRFIFNRGFEILDRTHSNVDAVAAESLFQGYDAGKGSYREVSEEDRQWLLGQLNRVKDELKIPVVTIDYVPHSQRQLARETAKRIMDLGLTPWVATPDLGSVGVGRVEVMPRRVLVVHSPAKDEFSRRKIDPIRLSAMPLSYMGYVPEFVNANNLPQFSLKGRYAGVVIWLTDDIDAVQRTQLATWVGKQVSETVPVALVNQIDFLLEGSVAKVLGLVTKFSPLSLEPISVLKQDPMMGFERAPHPIPDGFYGLSVENSKPLLTLQRGKDVQLAAAITPWGGYVIQPYAVIDLPAESGDRWVIDPFAFFRQALRLPEMPVPDVTTETGRRLLMVHMDGDGFVSRSDQPGNPLSGEVVRDRVVRKYPVPMTISVIEGEISPQGLFPALSAVAEGAAKDIFREPNVALASHSYSHPFFWGKASADAGDGAEDYHLPIPGYQFSLSREIEGSIRYIESRLAPPGKKVDMFLWTGDCIPGSEALRLTTKLNVLNMNGGDTLITKNRPSLTRVEGLGLAYAGGFQVYAPNQNENVYTNLWRGPFYGFEQVIETYQMTETPRRLKPINIYFHTYLASKRAGLKSLEKIFDYALSQETNPVFISEYARKVVDFQHLGVARTETGWLVRGGSHLRTLRLPSTLGVPDFERSQAVAGYRAGTSETYIHMGDSQVELVLQPSAGTGPVLVSANARIASFETSPDRLRWELTGHVPLRFTLANVGSCQIAVGGKNLLPVSRANHLSHYELKDHAARPLEAICRG
ncbi:MAG: endo alpha-1,4 polygalactosaminidase [Rhodoferax sp.]|nr:endo alpha-1,4 polygalactosaminidase [Rhodoferax sp.]